MGIVGCGASLTQWFMDCTYNVDGTCIFITDYLGGVDLKWGI